MQSSITQGSIAKPMLRFFFPIWAGTFFQFFYNTADAVIVGNLLGKEALSAVGGPSGTIINLLVGFFVGLSAGATVIISQCYGARDDEGTRRAVHTAAAFSLLAGALLTVLGFFAAPAVLQAMGTPEDVMALSVTYLRVYFLGMVGNLIYNVGSGVLRAVGDSRHPLYFLIACSLSNVVLDLVFILVFQMGVMGAALATILSQAVSALLVIVTLCRAQRSYQLKLKAIRMDWEVFGKMLRIGLPAGLQSIMYNISNVIIQASINSFGTNAVAAWSAYGKIDGLYWMTINAFGIAITTFAGQNFGARQYDRLRKSVRVCMRFSLGASLLLAGVLSLLGPICYGFFTNDAEVIAIGLRMMQCIVPFYFAYVPIEILSGAVRGAGDALVPMLIPAIGICLLRVLWMVFVVPMYPVIEMTCLCYPVTWVATALLMCIYYLQGGWLRRRIRIAHQ